MIAPEKHMIKLTKINGHECFLNNALIEIIEESPDTLITMSNGNRYLVLESCVEIRDKILEFHAEILRRAGEFPTTSHE
jgi:flagellar protein FlbD